MNMPMQPTEPSAPDAASTSTTKPRRNPLLTIKKIGNPWLLAALLLAGLASWQWLSTHHQLQHAIANSQPPSPSARQDDGLNSLQTRLNALEQKLNNNLLETSGLQAAYRDISNNRDAVLLAEVDHALVLANHQLQLNGNIPTAIAALQLSEQRLNRDNRPDLAPVHRAIKQDLDRLRALPNTDLPALAQQIDQLILPIDTLPMALDARPKEPAEPPNSTASISFDRLWQSLWRDLRGLVRIERMDTVSPLYLPPEAQFFVRENIKLRLLTARLALLARQQNRFKHELNTVQSLLTQHFDVSDPEVQKITASLAQLASSQIHLAIPSLQDSLQAVRYAQQHADKRAKP